MFKLSTKLTFGPILIVAMMLIIGISTGCGNSEKSKSNDKKSDSLHINAHSIVDAYSKQGYLLSTEVTDKGPFHVLKSAKKNLPTVTLDGKIDDVNWVSIMFPIFAADSSSNDVVENLVKISLRDIFSKDSSDAVYKEMMSNISRSVQKHTDKTPQISFGYVRGDKEISGFIQAVSDGGLVFVTIAAVPRSSSLQVGAPTPKTKQNHIKEETVKLPPYDKNVALQNFSQILKAFTENDLGLYPSQNPDEQLIDFAVSYLTAKQQGKPNGSIVLFHDVQIIAREYFAYSVDKPVSTKKSQYDNENSSFKMMRGRERLSAKIDVQKITPLQNEEYQVEATVASVPMVINDFSSKVYRKIQAKFSRRIVNGTEKYIITEYVFSRI